MPPPSKTSPINVQAAEKSQQVPETASKSSGRTTPASIISLSEVKLQDGTATLPLISEVAPTPFSGSLAPGQPNSWSETGSGKSDSKVNGLSAGQTSGDQAGRTGNASGIAGAGTGQRDRGDRDRWDRWARRWEWFVG